MPNTLSIALIGLRGSGKTTVGRALARKLKLAHVDTDDVVMRQAGRSIAEIFAAEGEAGFRRREAGAVRAAVAQSPAIISVGGGAVLDPSNVAVLKGAARVVWLTAETAVLRGRLESDPNTPASRPSLTEHLPIDELEATLRARRDVYADAADAVLSTDAKTVGQLVDEIVEWLQHPRLG